MAKTILVAVEGAGAGPAVVPWAGKLAGAMGAHLVLLHVAPPEEMQASLKAFAHEYGARGGSGGAPGGTMGTFDSVGVDMANLPGWFHDAITEVGRVTETGDVWSARTELAHLILERAVEAAQKAGAKDCEAVVKTGDPLEGILKAAEESEADLIVVGAHEGSLLHHLVHRGISDRLLSESKRPCLVVPTGE